jgi:hypothetical protein
MVCFKPFRLLSMESPKIGGDAAKTFLVASPPIPPPRTSFVDDFGFFRVLGAIPLYGSIPVFGFFVGHTKALFMAWPSQPAS